MAGEGGRRAEARLHGNGAVPPRERAHARARCRLAGGTERCGRGGAEFGPRGPPSAVTVAYRKVSGEDGPRCCHGNAAGRTGGAGRASAGGGGTTSSPRPGGGGAAAGPDGAAVSRVSEAGGAGSRGGLR